MTLTENLNRLCVLPSTLAWRRVTWVANGEDGALVFLAAAFDGDEPRSFAALVDVDWATEDPKGVIAHLTVEAVEYLDGAA